MKPFTKNTPIVLKSMLLLALAANVSVKANVESKVRVVDLNKVESTELASVGSDTVAQAKPAADTKPPTAEEVAELKRKLNEAEHKLSLQQPPKAQAPAPATETVQISSREAKRVVVEFCQEKSADVAFEEVSGSNGIELQGRVLEADCDSCRTKAFLVTGGDNANNRRLVLNEMKRTLRDALGCESQPTEEEKKLSREEIAAENKKLSELAAACEIKITSKRTSPWEYEEVAKDDELRCHIDRLTTIASEKDWDAKDEGRRSSRRSRESESSRLMSAIETLVNKKIKSKVKSMLLSNNEDRADEGMELAQEVIEALEDLRDSEDLSEGKMKKLIGHFEGLKASRESLDQVQDRASKYEERIEKVRENAAYGREVLAQNPSDYRAQMTWQNAMNEALYLDQMIQNLNQPFTQTQARFVAAGYLDRSDLDSFMKLSPYEDFKRTIDSIVNGGKTSAVAGQPYRPMTEAPADLSAIRSGALNTRGGTSFNGLPTTAPQLNLNFGQTQQSLGLNPTFNSFDSRGLMNQQGPQVCNPAAFSQTPSVFNNCGSNYNGSNFNPTLNNSFNPTFNNGMNSSFGLTNGNGSMIMPNAGGTRRLF